MLTSQRRYISTSSPMDWTETTLPTCKKKMEHLPNHPTPNPIQQTHLTIDSTNHHHHLHKQISSQTPLLPPPSRPNSRRPKRLITGNLSKIRHGLKWFALGHSSLPAQAISFLVFLLFVIIIPAINAALSIGAPQSDASAGVTFHKLAQLPQSALATIAFFSLSRFILDDNGIQEDSSYVQHEYAKELDRAFKYIVGILLPAFAVELAHKIIFFSMVSVNPPAFSDRLPVNLIMFMAGLASWVYRTGVFLVMCALFRLTCELQILRLEGFKRGLEVEFGPDPYSIFVEHVRIKGQLLNTSHRYRIFIIGCLITITITQLGALLLEFASKSPKNFFNAGDLIVCSAVQLSGFCLCLMGAARITHRAQGVAAIATRWHMVVTCKINESIKETTIPNSTIDPRSTQDFGDSKIPNGASSGRPVLLGSSFEARQALVNYLQHNNGGFTLFGFVLDRGLLHTLFAFETSLVLWILSKVIEIY